MMKYFLLLLLLTSYLFAQSENEINVHRESGRTLLLGEFEREAFKDTSYAWWFNSGYKNYSVDSSALAGIGNIDDIEITIILGSWCSDSKREVPRFLKILDHLNFDPENGKLIGVDRDEKGLEDEVAGLEIELVPTFIFYREGKEIGRIVESPENSLEEDLSRIVQK